MWLGIVLYFFSNFMVLFISGQSSGLSFQNVPPLISINETTPLRTNIQQISVLNTNPQNPINVSCSSSSSQEACDTFKLTAITSTLSNWNGFLYLDKTLDYTRIQSYILQLSATDNSNPPVTLSLTINVMATRYRPPQFARTYIIEIAERNGASSEAIFTFQASSPNAITSGFPIRYRILPNQFSSYFQLDEVSGVLTNLRPLQTSDPVFNEGMAVLQIEAAYLIQNVPAWNNSDTSSITNATIYFPGSNLYLPTFDKTSYNGSVKETALPGTFVDTIFLTVTDLDKPLSASSFSLITDKETDKFEVRPSGGVKFLEARISVVNSGTFSYNKGPRQYSFNVIASDGTPDRTSQVAVTVNLVQVNRFAPTFFQNPYNVTISEMAQADTPVVQVKAWDEDDGPTFGNESIKYRIGQGSRELFNMTEDGLISLARCRTYGLYPCLDYEREDLRTYILIVYAMDIKGEGLTSTATVIINLSNENDNPPKFSFEDYRGSIDDNSTVLTILPGPIMATDADGDNITYSIRAGNEKNLWRIDLYTGVLTPVRPILYIDAPITGSFNLVIEASDGVHNTLANVNITVKPLNRYPPIFMQKLYNVSISKSTAPGTIVVQVKAIDRDPPNTPGGNVTYRLQSGGQDFFNVMPTTGDVILRVQLNQATPPNYVLQIQASDQDAMPKTDTTTVIINILQSLLFIPSYDITISDDSPLNTVVTTLVATTEVQTPDLLYTFIPPIEGFDINMNPLRNFTNDDRELFKINGSNGIVQVSKSLNYERVPIWRSVVQVIERNSNPDLTATGTITIRITPSNKLPPVFNKPWTSSLPFYNLTVEQGDIKNPEVATFTALSPNQSLSILYELVDLKNYFRLQAPTSGIIIQQRPFLELVQNYSFLLIAKDNGIPPLSSTATINVVVTGSNIYAPTFNQAEYSTQIYENATAGSLVIKVTATDRDAGDYGIIKYSIDPSVSSIFSINPDTGAITVAPGATFDAAKHPQIDFIVTAVDSPGTPSKQQFATAFVKVTVLDINNHYPTFTASEFRIQILDTFPKDSMIIQVPATDSDLGMNAKINYAIVTGNDQRIFSIDDSGNIYLRQSLVGKESRYVLNVTATDGGIPALSSFCTVYISVAQTCGSACNPLWLHPSSLSTELNVSEDINVGYVIFVLNATNYLGQMGNITFSFVNNNQKTAEFENFKLVPVSLSTTNLSLGHKFDYGSKRQHSFKIEASDNFVPGSSVLRFFTINVIPSLNPQFPFNSQTNCTLQPEVEIPDIAKSGTVITKVTAATRFTNEQVIYSVADKSPDLPIYVNNLTGEIILSSGTLNPGTYNVTVNARYPNKVNQTTFLCDKRFDQSNITIFIKIIDLSPMYTSDPINYCIDNSLESGSIVLQLNDELVNNNIGEIRYERTNKNADQYLTLTTEGTVYLKTAAANIKESPLDLKVNSSLVQYPNKAKTVSTEGYIVNRATDLILVTLKQPLTDFLSGGKKPFMNTMRKYGKVCYVDASYHSTEQGIFNIDQTDVFLYIIKSGSSSKPILPLELDQSFNTLNLRREADIIGITGAVSKWDGFNYNPVAIAIGLIMGLLLLCLLFFCCCCLWPFLAKYCMSSVETEPLVAKSLAGGIINRDWAINPQLQEQQHLSMDVPDTDATVGKSMAMLSNFGQDYGDEDILQAESFKSTVRREDSATVDGVMSNEGLQPVVPAGYVHIEAPLAPSRNASAMGTVDGLKAGNAVKTITETTLQESFERSQGARTIYNNQDDINRQTLYSRMQKGEIQEFMDEDEPQGPVQLNEASNMGSQIGATLIKAEPVGGMTHVQNIISGSEPVIAQNSFPGMEYTNYSGTLVADPSRSDMAYSNEVVFSGLRPVSRHEEIGGTLRIPRNELLLNPMNAGSTRESSYMERFEETRFL